MTALCETFVHVQSVLGQPYEDLKFLLSALKNALVDNGEEDLANDIPWINENEIQVDKITPKHIQLYSLIFQLVNIVEING
ncbi:MAG: hypothetical protein AAF600_20100, partial [Bacteroidota bacterium]